MKDEPWEYCGAETTTVQEKMSLLGQVAIGFAMIVYYASQILVVVVPCYLLLVYIGKHLPN